MTATAQLPRLVALDWGTTSLRAWLLGDQLNRIRDPGRIILCGATDLCRRYDQALRTRGVQTGIIGEDATARGLWRIATKTGLVATRPEASTSEGFVLP